MPLFRGQSALYYNTDMFAAAGLTEPPKTMDDIDAYAEKLTQRDASGAPTVSGWSMRLSGGGSGIAEKFAINMFQYGGELIAPAGEGKWQVELRHRAGVATLKQYLHNLFDTKTVTIEMPADADAFEREQTAMFIRESWVIGDIAAKAPDLKYATATLPRGSIVAPVSSTSSRRRQGGRGLGLRDGHAGAGKSALAARQCRLAAEPLGSRLLGDHRGEAGASKPSSTTPANYEFFTLPAIGPIEEILTRAAAFLVEAFAKPELAADDAAIDAFLENADDEINAILEREGLLGSVSRFQALCDFCLRGLFPGGATETMTC